MLCCDEPEFVVVVAACAMTEGGGRWGVLWQQWHELETS